MNIPFLCLPDELDIRPTHTSPLWLARVLRSIKDKHLSRYRFRSDQIWILRHVTRPVHFARMVDFLYDLDPRLGRNSVSAEFATLVIVVAAIDLVCRGAITLRYMNGGDLEVVLCLARGVRAEKQSVDGVGLVWRTVERLVRGREPRTRRYARFFVWEPLACQTWPVQRVCDD